MVRGEHGVLPVPAAGGRRAARGVPIYSGGVAAELTTPTGAAILAASAERYGATCRRCGSSHRLRAGSRQRDEPPTCPRGARRGTVDDSPVTEGWCWRPTSTTSTPELAPWVLERLFEAGAADVWLTPILMKKGRPGITLSVLCAPGTDAAVRELLWRETSTLGVRGLPVRKWMLERRMVTVSVPGGKVRVKLGLDGGRVVDVTPPVRRLRPPGLGHRPPAEGPHGPGPRRRPWPPWTPRTAPLAALRVRPPGRPG